MCVDIYYMYIEILYICMVFNEITQMFKTKCDIYSNCQTIQRKIIIN
jgi:hypothetical protein